MAVRGIIFDFDGVIADSEIVANKVFAEHLTQIGLPTTVEDALTLYLGKGWREVSEDLERRFGKALPGNFIDHVDEATVECLKNELKEVSGAKAFIQYFIDLPHCIASSSSLKYLQVCLNRLKLTTEFGSNVFSADMVARGKPHPDIYLYAADQIQVAAAECVVIEDSVNGVRASVAAGIKTIGLCAGSHVLSGHGQRLVDAGASYVANSWNDTVEIVSELRG